MFSDKLEYMIIKEENQENKMEDVTSVTGHVTWSHTSIIWTPLYPLLEMDAPLAGNIIDSDYPLNM